MKSLLPAKTTHPAQAAEKSQKSIVRTNFADKRDSNVAQRTLQEMMAGSPHTMQLQAAQEMAGISTLTTAKPVDEKEPLLGKFTAANTAQLASQKTTNQTGLPDQLKSGIESLSGMAMDHVRVHYNSTQPAQLNAHAYF